MTDPDPLAAALSESSRLRERTDMAEAEVETWKGRFDEVGANLVACRDVRDRLREQLEAVRAMVEDFEREGLLACGVSLTLDALLAPPAASSGVLEGEA